MGRVSLQSSSIVYMENDDEIVVVLILLSGKGVSPEDPTYCRGKLSLAVCAC